METSTNPVGPCRAQSLLLVSGLTFVGMVGGCTYNHLRDDLIESHERLTRDHEEARRELKDYYDIKHRIQLCEWELDPVRFQMMSNQYDVVIKHKPIKYKVVK